MKKQPSGDTSGTRILHGKMVIKKKPTSKKKTGKHPGGRPGTVTKEVVAKLEQAFAVGATDLEACFFAGISKDAFYRYCDKHEEFRERKEALKQKPVLLAKTNVIKKLQAADIDTSKWYLERKAKKEFSTRIESSNMNIEVIPSEEQQEKIEKMLDDIL